MKQNVNKSHRRPVSLTKRTAKPAVRPRLRKALGPADHGLVMSLDPSRDALAPTLIALKRKRDAPDWVEQVVPFGNSFKSTALPRFTLNLKRKKRK